MDTMHVTEETPVLNPYKQNHRRFKPEELVDHFPELCKSQIFVKMYNHLIAAGWLCSFHKRNYVHGTWIDPTTLDMHRLEGAFRIQLYRELKEANHGK